MQALEGETFREAYNNVSNLENPPWVSFGRSHYEACAHHVRNTFNAKRAYIISSTSLSKNTNEVEKLKTALGDRLIGVRIGIAPHTPWNEIADATKDALDKKADCLITIGGGSLVDGAKAMLLFMANNVVTVPDILSFGEKLRFTQANMRLDSNAIDCVQPEIPLICIPTTLSGGEYTQYAGGTDPETHYKLVMGHPFCAPKLIINDPKLTITTPEWAWLSTGVRGIDHCVECYCRTHLPDDEVDEASLKGFKLILPNLLIIKKDWNNEEARLNCMLGVSLSLFMLKHGILGGGASHGIGHQLGPLNVGHGQTSCILLPSVMKYNAKVNQPKQDMLKKVMWSEEPVAKVLRSRGLQEESSDVGDCLDATFRELGMPRSLQEVGVGSDKFDELAANSLKDSCCEVNPVPLVSKKQVIEILEMCAK